MVTKTVTKSSHSSKEKSAQKERRSALQQSATRGQSSTTDVAALLKEALSSLVVEMNKGFRGSSSLVVLFKVKNDAKGYDNAPALSDPQSDDHGGRSDKEPEEYWQL